MQPLAQAWSDAELEERLSKIPTSGRREIWQRMARRPYTEEESRPQPTI
ncbi:MAG: hypothetical protein WDN49_26525 [Acetobacteraceae bacterium]